MVSAEEDDIKAGYQTLLHELEQFNPELLVKERVLAITKCDLIDEQIEREMLPQLPKGIPHVFISSVSGEGLKELKEELWKALHK
jgi:GTP-binding protein